MKDANYLRNSYLTTPIDNKIIGNHLTINLFNVVFISH